MKYETVQVMFCLNINICLQDVQVRLSVYVFLCSFNGFLVKCLYSSFWRLWIYRKHFVFWCHVIHWSLTVVSLFFFYIWYNSIYFPFSKMEKCMYLKYKYQGKMQKTLIWVIFSILFKYFLFCFLFFLNIKTNIIHKTIKYMYQNTMCICCY